MKRGVVNPKPVIKKAPVLYLINYPATISFILHRRSNVSGRCLPLSDQCDSRSQCVETLKICKAKRVCPTLVKLQQCESVK